ncbi:MAG: PDDEXK nuclease domain-containing protein [Bacteroidales bacterium]|nr:PDDEXK nuclease domain-containing protein [Bacteroidales bacterium]
MDKDITIHTEENLFDAVSSLIDDSRKQVAKAINTAMVYTYYGVGQYIVEYEQEGNDRAEYGKCVLKRLSAELTAKYGEGWSIETLKKCRKFFLEYQIGSTAQTQTPEKDRVYSVDPIHKFTLSWNHYQILMREKNPQARSFYEIEAYNQQWSVRQLQRQVASSLYERLALSRDKKEVMRLANEGQTVEKPADIIKNPLVLEFLGLKPEAAYTEKKLETAILDKLEAFLLECGKGFLFEARQERFSFDEDNFYVDLVLYNRILQCYVLIDLKVDKLTHQDLGQMMMYVNYFDRHKRADHEKPTIGILLCPTKNDALVELTLPKDANIYAQEYTLYLPRKEELQQKLTEWVNEFEENNNNLSDND